MSASAPSPGYPVVIAHPENPRNRRKGQRGTIDKVHWNEKTGRWLVWVRFDEGPGLPAFWGELETIGGHYAR